MKSSVFALSLLLILTSISVAEEVAPGIVKEIFKVPETGNEVWLYHPEAPSSKKLTTVLVAPAGSSMYHGMPLVKEDEAEHIPYARAGMVVIAYETSGQIKNGTSNSSIKSAFSKFVRSKGGVLDAANALKAATGRFSFIDTDSIYSVGHSSAGTLALQVAQNSNSIKGCIAYAPVINLGPTHIFLLQAAPETGKLFLKYQQELAPSGHIDKLTSPVLIFQAADDRIVSAGDTERFVQSLSDYLKAHDFEKIDTGGHYQSMIDVGIPRAIEWIRAVEGGKGPEPPSADTRLLTGKTLTLNLLPGMKTREYSKSEIAKDYFVTYWKHPIGTIAEVSLDREKSDVTWAEVEEAAQKMHEIKNRSAAKTPPTSPVAEDSYSAPSIAPIKKGPFRGFWIRRKVHAWETGENVISAYYLLWDRKDMWLGQFHGGESEQIKFHTMIENAVINKPE